MADIQHISLGEVICHFAELEDPRSTINRRHPLVGVIVIAMMAILAGLSHVAYPCADSCFRNSSGVSLRNSQKLRSGSFRPSRLYGV